MPEQLRAGVVAAQPDPRLSGQVECDEVYGVAGHDGHSEAVKACKGRRRRLKGARGRGTLDKGKAASPGEAPTRPTGDHAAAGENVQQKTIEPLIRATVCPGTQMDTDEYDIDARLRDWGFVHSTVCHGQGEYARDEDGDGFDEVHVNTIEGFWSLLRSWLRPPSGDLPREAAVVPGLLPVRAQYLDPG